MILRRDPPPGVPFPPETARRLSEAFLDNLARLHRLDYAAIGLADLGKPQGYLERQVKGWIERYHNSKTHDLAGSRTHFRLAHRTNAGQPRRRR